MENDRVKKNNKVAYHEIEAKPVIIEEEVDTTPGSKPRSKPVIAQPLEVYKKPLYKRFTDTLFGSDGVFSYLGAEIILPAIKNIIVDSISSGINMAVFGNDQKKHRSSNIPFSTTQTSYGTHRLGTSSRYTNYGKASTSNLHRSYDNRDADIRASNRVIDYRIPDRQDALEILHVLTRDAAAYDVVSVADYYDLLGVTSQYTDNSYGWRLDDLQFATVQPVAGGYIINFPKPEAI